MRSVKKQQWEQAGRCHASLLEEQAGAEDCGAEAGSPPSLGMCLVPRAALHGRRRGVGVSFSGGAALLGGQSPPPTVVFCNCGQQLGLSPAGQLGAAILDGHGTSG